MVTPNPLHPRSRYSGADRVTLEKGNTLTDPVSSNTSGLAPVSARPDFLAKVIYGKDLQPMPERVAKGARLLDMLRPIWASSLDGDYVVQMGPDPGGFDVLSLLYGDYLTGITALDLPSTGPVDHGFTLPQAHNNARMWWHLTRHWRSEIVSRQEGQW